MFDYGRNSARNVGPQPGIKHCARQDTESSQHISFPHHCSYSPLLNVPRFLTFATRKLAESCFRDYLLTGSQAVHSKRGSVQYEWLAERHAQFLSHQLKKTTSTFFPRLYEEYFTEWPPSPTEEEIAASNGEISVATTIVQKIEENVRDFKLKALIHPVDRWYRESTVGCTTVVARNMV